MLNDLMFCLGSTFKCATKFEIPPKCVDDFQRIFQMLARLPRLCLDWLAENLPAGADLDPLEKLLECIKGILISLS